LRTSAAKFVANVLALERLHPAERALAARIRVATTTASTSWPSGVTHPIPAITTLRCCLLMIAAIVARRCPCRPAGLLMALVVAHVLIVVERHALLGAGSSPRSPTR
jgi:hypothetical protein